MTRVSELGVGATELAGALGTAADAIDLDQEITFQVYTRVVLPVDGFVFWKPTVKQTYRGSLHFAQDIEQAEDETVGVANVTFTTREHIAELSEMGAATLYVAQVAQFRIAFAHQHGFYQQAGLWHYSGRSIYPALASQLLDTPGVIDASRAVTSNSLALWLALSAYEPVYGDGPTSSVTLYPSDLVPMNLIPPYGAVHIGEDDTRALQAVPYIDQNGTSWQLMADRVRVVLYGLQSNEAVDFLNAVLGYSLYTGNFGLMNTPAVRDAKRPQAEIQAIAMQKVIDFEVSYLQTRVQQVARQLITSAVPSILLNPAA